MAELEREKQKMKDRSFSLEAQLILKGRAVKEVEGRIDQNELKHKEVSILLCLSAIWVVHGHVNVHCVFL